MKKLNPDINALLQQGTVIPAHPLALTEDLKLDEERQRALTNYYITCGAGGVAVGVHTTQFEIRKPEINLLEPVLQIAAEEIEKAKEYEAKNEERRKRARNVMLQDWEDLDARDAGNPTMASEYVEDIIEYMKKA